MFIEKSSKRVDSYSFSSESQTGVAIGADLSGDPVFLSGKVIPSVTFARFMLILGNVVRLPKKVEKDHTAYQEWVATQYLHEFELQNPGRMARIAELSTKIEPLQRRAKELSEEQLKLWSKLRQYKQNFYTWLLSNNREAWVVLDPIVSVQADGTFFEAFSEDESVYARVFLPHDALKTKSKPNLGTTNIDYSVLLEREFSRVRSYRPLELEVGLNKVDISTSAAQVKEERIPLPETWVRGLVEVQSVLSLAPIKFNLSADSIAELLALLDSKRERKSPRSLRFQLKPGRPIRMLIEPWGDIYDDDQFIYEGEIEQEIRVWGRRRLKVLRDILTDVDSVEVLLIGSGMPTFWTVKKDGVELTVGLSSWTSNDWSSKAKFSALIPSAAVDETDMVSGLAIIKEKGTITAQELSKLINKSTSESAFILQKLCMIGKLMFDPERKIYRNRDLFPGIDLGASESQASREERFGIEIFKSKGINVTEDIVKDEVRYLESELISDNNIRTQIEQDMDARPKYAQCSCSYFAYNKLRQGPCRHIVALTLVGA